MSENTYKPRNYRIVRHVTKNRILDVQDALDIGKLRIELVEFAEGEGATQAVEHYAEPDALALVCYDILQARSSEKYVEFKGTVQGETAISRVLVIERVEARNPIKITVSRGPGKTTGQGAIQPLGKPEASLSVLLSEFDARRIALTILRHLAAYEAATYHARVAANTRRPSEYQGPRDEEPEAQAPAGDQEEAAGTQRTEEQASGQPELASAATEATAPPARPMRRPPAPPVETYWMAAERLGLARDEAEQLLQSVDGDWSRAWSALRRREQEVMAR